MLEEEKTYRLENGLLARISHIENSSQTWPVKGAILHPATRDVIFSAAWTKSGKFINEQEHNKFDIKRL